METLRYMGYIGSVKYDKSDNTLYGEILNAKDSISYEIETLEELQKAFETEVDRYVKFCSCLIFLIGFVIMLM